jgi:hypothetical protein
MKQISYRSIEKAIDVIDNLDDDSLEAVSEKYSLNQPELAGYLWSAAMEYENEVLEGLIIYYFCLISEAFSQEGIELEKISVEQIESFEEIYSEILDSFFETEDYEVLEDFCDQPSLVQFILIELSEEDEDGTSLDDQTSTQLFAVLVAMIALMSKSIIQS